VSRAGATYIVHRFVLQMTTSADRGLIQQSLISVACRRFGQDFFRLSPLVSGTTYRATSRLHHPYEFFTVVQRIILSIVPFPTFCSAFKVTSVFLIVFVTYFLLHDNVAFRWSSCVQCHQLKAWAKRNVFSWRLTVLTESTRRSDCGRFF